jgi:formylglycine-generating enzyme required for sulfatase activity
MNEDDQRRLNSARIEDVDRLVQLADRQLRGGDLHAAATALDHAYGLNPSHPTIAQRRAGLLDRLSVGEHGIMFRYIPGGAFLMGSNTGDPDEQPVHEVTLSHYWLSETPISWAMFCRVLGWEPPPQGCPRQPPTPLSEKGFNRERFELLNDNKICLQYCEDQTLRARDWHAHFPPETEAPANAEKREKLFGHLSRSNPDADFSYDTKPMVSVRFAGAERFCAALSPGSPPTVKYRLPTEAEWEKAARGGLVGNTYPWGNEAPTDQNCDFNRFKDFSVRPMKTFPPNGYGLYAMSGGVWEWTSDWYDAAYYAQSRSTNPSGPAQGTFRVVRGGSWADCAEAVTVTFRMTLNNETIPWGTNPNIGFRICRCAAAENSGAAGISGGF